MKHGFINVAAISVPVKVASPKENAEKIIELIKEVGNDKVKVIVCQELCITGYTCGDLFFQGTLLKSAREALLEIAKQTADVDALIFVGLPLEVDGKLYNVAAALSHGEILAFIPKTFLPNYNEFYEARYFAVGPREAVDIVFEGSVVPFGRNILLECSSMKGLVVGCEICEDAWVAHSPSMDHALAGATVIANLSASSETVGKSEYREKMLEALSCRLICAYIYAAAGEGESSQDLVFGGNNIVAEYGEILKKTRIFDYNITAAATIDIEKLQMVRRINNTFVSDLTEEYVVLPFALEVEETELRRDFPGFVPEGSSALDERCETILSIQARALMKRLTHINCKKVVLGLSGGLDSTLALLVCKKAFEELKLDPAGIIGVTMPGFGTTGRTYQNACRMARLVGATLKEISIKKAVEVHFEDIGQDPDNHDVTYENSQARERTQILMDLANKENALVVGTGDMSELALGWATYNGDHMSMYGVNAGVPKTLVRHLVDYYSCSIKEDNYYWEEDESKKERDLELKAVLQDVLSTPVSPELLPPKDGEIAQVTEDLVGPYELHDFFLYYMLRCGYEPDKIFRIARKEFALTYDAETILKWLKTFYRRFFAQQFKRSCMPDGVKVGSVALSPRGDLRMPSDACAKAWLEKLDEIVIEEFHFPEI